ncbi:transcriptional regulator [Pleomorphomonas carboxyditropha]
MAPPFTQTHIHGALCVLEVDQAIGNLSLNVDRVNIGSGDMNTITGAQLRAGRALIRWSANDLAKAANVGVATIRRAEATDGAVTMVPNNLVAIRAALEAAGVIFVDANGEGPGVRLKKVHG